MSALGANGMFSRISRWAWLHITREIIYFLVQAVHYHIMMNKTLAASVRECWMYTYFTPFIRQSFYMEASHSKIYQSESSYKKGNRFLFPLIRERAGAKRVVRSLL